MHADGSGIQDGVKRFAAQRAAPNDFAANGFGQFLRGLFSPRTNANARASLGKRARRSSRGATRTEDQDAAPSQRKLFFEGAQNPDVIGIAAGKRTIAPDDHSIDGGNLRGQRVAFFQVFQDGLFVRDGYTEAANPEFRHRFQKIAKIMHEEWEIDSVHTARDKTGVVQ